MLKLSKYRSDIDGLRAIAVMSVVIFHTGVSQLSGGFTGVDVFYVISGYLITSLILKDFELGRFSFSQFYARRVKRLLPAAIVVILVSLFIGYFMLAPSDYSALAKSALFASVFGANFWFATHSGYFDQDADFSPLIHMWSLSVEEQYYLLYPLLIYGVFRRFGTSGLKWMIIAITVISLATSILTSLAYPNFAYYLLPTRAWQLSVGGLLCFLPALRSFSIAKVNSLQLVCLIGLLWGFFFISSSDIYPGYIALVPTLCAAGILYLSAKENSLLSKCLSADAMVWIGKISYSIYLWHWPIVVYYRIYTNQHSFSPVETASLILASLILGYLSFRFVEEKFRYIKLPNIKTIFTGMAATGGVVAVCLLIWGTKGVQHRVPDEVLMITSQKQMWSWQCTEQRTLLPVLDEEYCVIGKKWQDASIKGIIWGDSHSQHWAQLVDHEASKHDMSFVIAPLKCPPYLLAENIQSQYPKFPNFTSDCTRRNKATIEWLQTNQDVSIVIMAAAWSGHVRMHFNEEYQDNLHSNSLVEGNSETGAILSEQALVRLLEQISWRDRKLLLLGDVPRPQYSLNDCLFAEQSGLFRRYCENGYMALDASSVKKWHHDSDKVLSNIQTKNINTQVILPLSKMCGAKECATHINNELIYMDGNHIRRNLKPSTLTEFSQLLGLESYFSQLASEHAKSQPLPLSAVGELSRAQAR